MTKLNKPNIILLICMFLMTFGAIALVPLPKIVSDGFSQYIFILIPCLIYLVVNKKNIKKTLKLNKLKFKDAIIVVALVIAIRPFVGLISYLASLLFGDFITQAVSNMNEIYSFPFLFFVIAITPAICEEVLMRGIVLDGYKSVGMRKAILLNGVLFGMMHLNLHQFAYTFFIGVVLAAVVYYTNSIFAGMLFHLVNNGLSVMAMYAMEKNLIETSDVEQAATQVLSNQQLLSLAIGAVISLALAYFLLKALKKSNYDKLRYIEEETRFERVPIINWSFILVTIYFLAISAWILFSLKG